MVAALAFLAVAGCGGGGGGSPAPAPSDQWGKISGITVNNQTHYVYISGTAWVSPSWVATHCYGFGCLFDESYDNYPGVDVTYTNLTTGVSGNAASYYGGGTDWVHEWAASVPLALGVNVIQISAYDPGGKGGTIGTINNVFCTGVDLGISSTVPLNGASNVPVNTPVSATFSASLDPSTVNASSFVVSGPSGTVAGSLVVSGATATFTPSANLEYFGAYTVRITILVKDTHGNHLASDALWTFSTGATPDTIPPSTPTGLTATLTGPGSVDLSWGVSIDNVGIQGYKLYRDIGYLKSVGTTTASDAGLGITTQYCYAVSAYDASKNESPPSNSACITTSDLSPGTAGAWGLNSSGQFGNGTSTNAKAPVQVANAVSIAAIAGGGNHSLAAKSDGTVWAWGQNFIGQLGDGTTTDELYPVQVLNMTDVTAVAAGLWHSLALKSDGTVWAWGAGGYGQVGDGTGTAAYSPVQVKGLSNVKAVAAGDVHSLALKSDGTIWAWGRNENGQLGDGTTMNRLSPVQVQNINSVVAIAAGMAHSLAVKSDGTVWAWGFNIIGQLGDGTMQDSSSPVRVLNVSNAIAVAAGSSHSLALASDGTVWAWGNNYDGQLGVGANIYPDAPVQVLNIGNVAAIAGRSVYSLALKTDGTVWTWGLLFDTGSYVPFQVLKLSNITAITAGSNHALALKGN